MTNTKEPNNKSLTSNTLPPDSELIPTDIKTYVCSCIQLSNNYINSNGLPHNIEKLIISFNNNIISYNHEIIILTFYLFFS